MRDSFLFYRSYYESLKELQADEQLEVYNAIMEYTLNGVAVELKGVPKAIFILMQKTIDSACKNYDKNKINGEKGGAPAGNQNAKKQPKNNPIEEKKQPKNNQDKDKDKDKDKDVDVDSVQQHYIQVWENNIGLITSLQIEILKSYIDDGINEELIIEAIKEAVNSNAKNLNYIKSILNRCLLNNIYTVEQFKASQVEFNNKKQKQLGKLEETEEQKTERRKKLADEVRRLKAKEEEEE